MPLTRALAVVVSVACIGALAGCGGGNESSQSSAAPPKAPGPYAPRTVSNVIASDLPALPPGIDRGARPPQVIKAVYEFAARHPEVLRYVPCFCGCERPGMGHKGNDDCFVTARDKAGKVTAWEPHGIVCEICLDVGLQAMQMHSSGSPTSSIRAAIEAKYSGGTGHHTPTPMPPGKGSGSHE